MRVIANRSRVRAAPWMFLAPYLLATLVFFVYPLGFATALAFHQTSGPLTWTYVGGENFRYVIADPLFRLACRNTIVYAACSVVLQLPLALGLAMMLNAKRDRMKGFFRLAIFAPNLVGPVFVGILFSMLFTPRYGLFNQAVHALFGFAVTGGLLEYRWLADPSLVMPALVIVSLWMYTGFNMIYFLAALQNVDQSLVEAARIDGAGPAGVFRAVTLPAIWPVATFVVITSTVGSFNLFELPYTLLNGGFGPNNSGLTIVGYLYQWIQTGDLGTAAAVGWVLTILILALSLVQIYLSGTARAD